MTYLCPVCGYDQLENPPERYEICPCCGTEFENDDELLTHEELRREWIAGGMKWWSTSDRVPSSWNPTVQLRNLDGAPWTRGTGRVSKEPVAA